jgi:GxxExxY protein
MNINFITGEVFDAAFKVHYNLGPGLYESVYEAALCLELKEKGLFFESQKPVKSVYNGIDLGLAFFADIVVENSVLIELKSIEAITKVHFKQVQTYLKLSNLRHGFLFNFNTDLIKNGAHKIINGY